MNGNLQRSRANQDVDDATVATFTAARGFLLAEWLGALLMLTSFIQLYFVGLRPGGSVRVAWAIGLGMLTLGTWMFWTNRRYYLGLEFPWRRRWEVAAMLVAGTAAVFWFMVMLATFLTWRGIAAF